MQTQPVIILARPQLGENMGAVARAMTNFGLTELRLAAPRDGWPNRKARETASGAEHIIDAARVFPDFAAAMADIHVAYATTARPRDMEKRVIEPAQAIQEMHAVLAAPAPHKIALVFGPERTGLENEEIIMCDTLITIPTAPENSSLNLAQSMVILGYEWHRQSRREPVLSRPLPEIAPKEDWQGLFAQLESYLDDTNYYRVDAKKPIMWQNMQNMLMRGQFSVQEIRSLRGMLRALWERRRKGQPETPNFQ